MGPTRAALEHRARVISRTTQSHNERSTARFLSLENCFPANNKLDEESMFALARAGHDHNAWPYQRCRAKQPPLWPRTLCCEAITVPPKRGVCHCLGAQIRRNRGVDKHLAKHRTPPLSSSTPSRNLEKILTSLTPPSRLRRSPLHLQTMVVRTLATPHVQSEFTSCEDGEGLHTETPHIAPIRELSVPQHTPAQEILQPKVAEKHGDIFPR